MKHEISKFIIQTIKDVGYPVDLDEDSNLSNDAGLDSLDVVDLCAAIEDKYNVHISDEEYYIFKGTISDVAELVSSKL